MVGRRSTYSRDRPSWRCGRVVGRDGPVAHGVAGQQSAMGEVERVVQDRPVRRLRRQRHALAPDRVHDAQPADPAALDRDAGESMVVADIEHQRDQQADRREGVGAWYRDVDLRRAVGHQADGQAHRVRGERRPTPGGQGELIGAGHGRDEASAESSAVDPEADAAPARRPGGAAPAARWLRPGSRAGCRRGAAGCRRRWGPAPLPCRDSPDSAP